MTGNDEILNAPQQTESLPLVSPLASSTSSPQPGFKFKLDLSKINQVDAARADFFKKHHALRRQVATRKPSLRTDVSSPATAAVSIASTANSPSSSTVPMLSSFSIASSPAINSLSPSVSPESPAMLNVDARKNQAAADISVDVLPLVVSSPLSDIHHVKMPHSDTLDSNMFPKSMDVQQRGNSVPQNTITHSNKARKEIIQENMAESEVRLVKLPFKQRTSPRPAKLPQGIPLNCLTIDDDENFTKHSISLVKKSAVKDKNGDIRTSANSRFLNMSDVRLDPPATVQKRKRRDPSNASSTEPRSAKSMRNEGNLDVFSAEKQTEEIIITSLIGRLRKEVEEKRLELTFKISEVSTLQERLSVREKEFRTLEAKIATCKQELSHKVETLKQSFDGIREELTTWQNSIQATHEIRDRIKKEIEDFKEDRATISTKLKENDDALKCMEETRSQSVVVNRELTINMEKQAQVICHLREALSEKSGLLAEARDRQDSLERMLEEEKYSARRLVERLDEQVSMTIKIQELEGKVKTLQMELVTNLDLLGQRETQISELRDVITGEREKLNKVTVELDVVKTRVHEVEMENVSFQQRIQATHLELSKIESERDSNLEFLKQIKDAYGLEQKECQALAEQVRLQSNKIMELHEQLICTKADCKEQLDGKNDEICNLQIQLEIQNAARLSMRDVEVNTESGVMDKEILNQQRIAEMEVQAEAYEEKIRELNEKIAASEKTQESEKEEARREAFVQCKEIARRDNAALENQLVSREMKIAKLESEIEVLKSEVMDTKKKLDMHEKSDEVEKVTKAKEDVENISTNTNTITNDDENLSEDENTEVEIEDMVDEDMIPGNDVMNLTISTPLNVRKTAAKRQRMRREVEDLEANGAAFVSGSKRREPRSRSKNVSFGGEENESRSLIERSVISRTPSKTPKTRITYGRRVTSKQNE